MKKKVASTQNCTHAASAEKLPHFVIREKCHSLFYNLTAFSPPLYFAGVILAMILVAWMLALLAGSMIEFLTVKTEKYYGIIVTVTFFFLPLVIILAAYGTIFHIARAHARGRGVSSFKKVM